MNFDMSGIRTGLLHISMKEGSTLEDRQRVMKAMAGSIQKAMPPQSIVHDVVAAQVKAQLKAEVEEADRLGLIPPENDADIQLLTPEVETASAHLWQMFPLMVDKVPPCSKGGVEFLHVQPTIRQAYVVSKCRNELRTTHPWLQMNIDGVGWMFDTLHERWMNRVAVVGANGDVLIGGLGMGMILWPILKKRNVRSVTVIEHSQDVIDLILPTLASAVGIEKLKIVVADGREWKPEPGQLFDYIWLDMVPGYGYGSMMMQQHQEWLDRYRPFLRRSDHTTVGCINHWGWDENLIWMLHHDTPFSEWPKEDQRPYPIGPGDPRVRQLAKTFGLFIENETHEDMAEHRPFKSNASASQPSA